MSGRGWKPFFVVAALFNFATGLPLLLLPQWTFAIAFRNPVEAGAGLASALWGDFGFCVVLIGVGYLFIARRPAQERGLIFLARSATARDGELGVC